MDTAHRGELGRLIQHIHEQVREVAPDVARVAMALYEPEDDILSTFVHSTAHGVALQGHQYRLHDVRSLHQLSITRESRLITDLAAELTSGSPHSEYVLAEGYRSSYTIPLFRHDALLGFLFFDSREKNTFRPYVLRELHLHAGMLAMAVTNDLMAVASVVGTVHMAREFAALRDYETGEHMSRMARYSRIMARDTQRWFGFDDEAVAHIFLYAPLHDIGKIGVPDHVLLKRGPLDAVEWEEMKLHTLKGARIVRSVQRDLAKVDLPEPDVLLHIVELHHEKLDGSGYPHGLHGDDVPPAARIVAVADVFDALTTERPYKTVWTFEEALADLRREVDLGKLDHHCVEALAAARDEVEAVLAAHGAGVESAA